MFQTIIIILGSASFGVIFKDHLTIKNELLNRYGWGVKRTVTSSNKKIEYLYSLLHKFLHCYCISFWLAWLLSGNILIGFISYIIAALITNKLNTFNFM